MNRRIIALVPDAFGGRGGMAVYLRNFLSALCRYPQVDEVVALPRVVARDIEATPAKLRYEVDAAGSMARHARAVAKLALSNGGAQLVICGHLNQLPFAKVLATRFGCGVLPICYGAEAWQPTRHWTSNYLCRRLDAFIAIRKLTAKRLKRWACIPEAHLHYLPNCVELADYGNAPPRADLVAKYGLQGRTVVMTVGRMDSTEKNKGFDEVIETLPLLVQDLPNVKYLIIGDGDDQPRLEAKSRALGVAERVVFAGYIPGAEKADHYRLAHIVAMPGSDPHYFDRYPFRFAFLEPLACGIPVVGSTFDDPDERADPIAQKLVTQVDPNKPADIKRGILQALSQRSPGVDPLMSHFAYEEFERKTHAILTSEIARNRVRQA